VNKLETRETSRVFLFVWLCVNLWFKYITMIQAILKSRFKEDVCLQLQASNHSYVYLCDCGQASDLTISDIKNIQAIFISHTHIDHFCNFDTILRHQLQVNRKVIICGPKGIAKNVQAKLLGYNWDILLSEEQAAEALHYEVREISESQIDVYVLHTPKWELEHKGVLQEQYLYENEVFSVEYTILNHRTPCVAYCFTEHSKVSIQKDLPFKQGEWIKILKQAFVEQNVEKEIMIEGNAHKAQDLFVYLEEKKGSKIAFVMDHLASQENHEKIINLCKQADELYIEAYYLHEELELAEKNHHSTAFLSGQVAQKAQVKKAIPIHFSRRHQTEEAIVKVIEEFEKGFNEKINFSIQ